MSYNWDLGEAGGPTYTASKQSKFNLDLEEGDYSVTLTVEDPDGESNSVSHSFSVTNLPPVAIIKSDKTSVFTEEIIEFSGDDSYDPEGDALDYLWDFGDGSSRSDSSFVRHAYVDSGKFCPSITVSDGYLSNTVTKTDFINVLGGGE